MSLSSEAEHIVLLYVYLEVLCDSPAHSCAVLVAKVVLPSKVTSPSYTTKAPAASRRTHWAFECVGVAIGILQCKRYGRRRARAFEQYPVDFDDDGPILVCIRVVTLGLPCLGNLTPRSKQSTCNDYMRRERK